MGEAGGEEGTRVRGPPVVDLSVVDYVLRKPFSDETFRRLLEAVEHDHLQVSRCLIATIVFSTSVACFWLTARLVSRRILKIITRLEFCTGTSYNVAVGDACVEVI